MLNCLKYGYKCRLAVERNAHSGSPIKVVNPVLDDPFNWRSTYAVLRNGEISHNFLNETEKDLTENWTTLFGTKEAIEHYKKTGKLTDDAFGKGKAFPARIDDASKYRKDGYDYRHWVSYWSPIDGIQVWVPKKLIFPVFTVYTYRDAVPANIKFLNILLYPFRFIPSYHKLKMDEYTKHTFRIGSVMKGFSVEFQIPLKFSFK